MRPGGKAAPLAESLRPSPKGEGVYRPRRPRASERRRYQRAGIPEYWVVDLDARAVERWTPRDDRPEVLDTILRWHPAGAASPLEVDLAALFTMIWGPE